MRQISYVGKSRLQAAERVLPDILRQWCSDWCLGEPGDDFTIIPATREAGNFSALAWRIASTSAGAVMLGASSSASWHRLLFGGDATKVPMDGIAEHLVGEAQQALVNAILCALLQDPMDTLLMDVAISTMSAVPRIVLARSGQESELCILLDASLLDAWLPMPAPRASLHARHEVLGRASLSVTLRLPLSCLSAACLGELQPGDIVKSETPLFQPVQLQLQQAQCLASGRLMQRDDRVVLQLNEDLSTGVTR